MSQMRGGSHVEPTQSGLRRVWSTRRRKAVDPDVKPRIPLHQQGRFHVAAWAVAVVALMFSLESLPVGSTASLWTAFLLMVAFCGLGIVTLAAAVVWVSRKRGQS